MEVLQKEKNAIVSQDDPKKIINIEQKKKVSINDKETTKASSSDKNPYQDINLMRDYVKEKTPKSFKENFELLKYISSGSVGTFYEGRCLKGNKQKVGLKFILNQKYKIKKEKTEDRNEEILLLKKLHHKHIVNLYGNFKLDEGNSCAILELAKYGDLENFQKYLLKKRFLPETLLNYLAKQLLDAIEYIHICKTIHMDIKQDNILIDSNLNVKLTDFSVSSSYASFNDNDIVILPFAGTTKFIAPEILGRKPVLIRDCSKVDIYSLGVVLYYLTYGIYPYGLSSIHGKEYDQIEKKIKEENLQFPEDFRVSKLYINFLEGLLNKDFNKRFDIKKALEHPWIKASETLFEEKEKIVCLEKFLVSLVTNSVPKFNEYIKQYSK